MTRGILPLNMHIKFPDYFAFGTSTSAYQIETAIDHDWLNVRARDGHLFNRTTDHEHRLDEDVAIIASLAPHYRMSLMWSRLQRWPYDALDAAATKQYTSLLQALTARGVKVMMVMHHFANPTWFSALGGWQEEKNIEMWLDFAKKLVETFGDYVDMWNTFNEPNLYTTMGFIAGEFPPFKKNLFTASRVINHLAKAHDRTYDYIKSRYPQKWIGISHNCAFFQPENIFGIIPSRIADWCYMTYAENLFAKADFFGMSYYARIGFDPFPITYLKSPEKIKARNKAHDDMWEYYPQGLEACILRFWNRYQKPLLITENGICTKDDGERIQAIRDYMKAIHGAMAKGADVRGYYHWSAWDNFEWSLGPTFTFGLYACDPLTKVRTKKPSADLYRELAFTKQIQVEAKD